MGFTNTEQQTELFLLDLPAALRSGLAANSACIGWRNQAKEYPAATLSILIMVYSRLL